jgi:hypothetical protein
LKPRIRQLLCLWLVMVIALLPPSGTLLAAMAPSGADAGGGPAHHLHHGQQGYGNLPAAHHDHDTPVSGPSAVDSGVMSAGDCHNALCASSCSGCTGCHAPPARAHTEPGRLTGPRPAMLPPESPTPHPASLFKPPRPVTA